MRYRMGMGAATAALLLCASAGSADTLEFHLTSEFSGAQQPAGTVKVHFESLAPGTVTLTIQALLVGTENISWLGVNFLGDPLTLGHSWDSGASTGPEADSVDFWNGSTGAGAAGTFKADGDGFFDIVFQWSGSSGPSGNEKVVYTLNDGGAGIITAASFDDISVGGPVGKTGFPAAAHVQGIAGGGSGWITVPIPQTAYLGFAGLALAAGVGVMKRRR